MPKPNTNLNDILATCSERRVRTVIQTTKDFAGLSVTYGSMTASVADAGAACTWIQEQLNAPAGSAAKG